MEQKEQPRSQCKLSLSRIYHCPRISHLEFAFDIVPANRRHQDAQRSAYVARCKERKKAYRKAKRQNERARARAIQHNMASTGISPTHLCDICGSPLHYRWKCPVQVRGAAFIVNEAKTNARDQRRRVATSDVHCHEGHGGGRNDGNDGYTDDGNDDYTDDGNDRYTDDERSDEDNSIASDQLGNFGLSPQSTAQLCHFAPFFDGRTPALSEVVRKWEEMIDKALDPVVGLSSQDRIAWNMAVQKVLINIGDPDDGGRFLWLDIQLD